MDSGYLPRRRFLKQSGIGLGGILLGSMLPETLFAAHQHAKKAAASSEELVVFTAAEAADLTAFAAQVIPGDDSPGAKEANVVYFLDYVLSEYQPDDKPPYHQALLALKQLAVGLYPSTASFSSLSGHQKTAVMEALEKQSGQFSSGGPYGIPTVLPPFELLRQAVVTGFLSDPVQGGNKDMMGWKWIGYDGASIHQPPFGYYDADALKQNSGSGQ